MANTKVFLHDILKKEYYNGKEKLKRDVVLDHLEDLRWLLVQYNSTVIMALPHIFLVITCLTLLYLGVQHLLPINFFVTYLNLRLTDSFCITEFPLSSRIPPWRDR
jgi:hypothetical protein